MTNTTRTYTTLADLRDQEIVDAINGVEENFDIDGFIAELRERDLIIWTGTGFALVIDECGNTPGFWEIVEEFDALATNAPVELYETDAVCLITRGGQIYVISDATSVAGQAATDGRAWIAGEWDPEGDLDTSDDDLDAVKRVATITADGVTIHNEPGANASIYLHGQAN